MKSDMKKKWLEDGETKTSDQYQLTEEADENLEPCSNTYIHNSNNTQCLSNST